MKALKPRRGLYVRPQANNVLLLRCAPGVAVSLLALSAGAQEGNAGGQAGGGGQAVGEQASSSASVQTNADGAVATAADTVVTEAQRGFFELGLFGGMMSISSDHNFRDPAIRDFQQLEEVAPDFGLRVGLYPVPFAGLEAEGAVLPTATLDGRRAVLANGRAHLLLQYPAAGMLPFVVAGAGVMGTDSETNGTDQDGTFHVGVGVKLPLRSGLDARVDIRDTISNARSGGKTPQFPELLMGLTWVIGGQEQQVAPAPPVDSDGDGVPDPQDACPSIAGDDGKGCPFGDQDQDGIADNLDQCPAQSGIEPDGCPNPDPDGDGVAGDADKCPQVAGVLPDGCPDQDPDQDGIPQPDDRCPNQPETANGFEDADGCPDEVPEQVKKFTGVIKGINFDLGKATISAGSHALLDSAAGVLTEYPSLRLKITGHTDSTGSRDRNLALSTQRAEAVKAYLVSRGVDASRLEALGMGPDEPIEDNATAAGRQANRRIEFRVVQPGSAKTPPAASTTEPAP
jgi:outer membrane protein OmpA-like peptidoglycan-associated protein